MHEPQACDFAPLVTLSHTRCDTPLALRRRTEESTVSTYGTPRSHPSVKSDRRSASFRSVSNEGTRTASVAVRTVASVNCLHAVDGRGSWSKEYPKRRETMHRDCWFCTTIQRYGCVCQEYSTQNAKYSTVSSSARTTRRIGKCMRHPSPPSSLTCFATVSLQSAPQIQSFFCTSGYS